MNVRITLAVVLALLLSGCKAIEGAYVPSCVAFSGSEIRLEGGRFVWEKFTDQVVVDEQGNKVDQFPDFPRQGSYAVSDDVVTLSPDTGSSETFHLLRDEGAVYLLTDTEKSTYDATGERPRCVLKRQPAGT